MRTEKKFRTSIVIFLVLILAAITFLLSGCGKDNSVTPDVPGVTTFCWECTLTLTTQGYSGSSQFTRCDLTVTEIRAVEADNTWVKTEQGVTTTAKTKCIKK